MRIAPTAPPRAGRPRAGLGLTLANALGGDLADATGAPVLAPLAALPGAQTLLATPGERELTGAIALLGGEQAVAIGATSRPPAEA